MKKTIIIAAALAAMTACNKNVIEVVPADAFGYIDLGIMTDTEMAAKIQYRYDNFWTVATKYPSSECGRRVRGRCDYWIDYHSESRLN